MNACPTCGEPVAPTDSRCPVCGTDLIAPAEPSDPSAGARPATAPLGEGRGSQTIAETDSASAERPDSAGPAEFHNPEKLDVARTLAYLGRSLRRSWQKLFLLALVFSIGTLGAVIFVRTFLGIGQRTGAADRQVAPGIVRQFETLIAAGLPEKLEWGRQILTKRIPSRFPEELLMDVDPARDEVKYTSADKTEASFQRYVAYHYQQLNKKMWVWLPVTYFFKLQDGKWVLIGDKWISDWSLVFE